jgi:hypothetical protein
MGGKLSMTLLLDRYPPQYTNVNHMVVKEAGAEALHQLLNLFGAWWLLQLRVDETF